MIDYEKTLSDIVMPMVEDPKSVRIQTMESVNENELILYVYAKSEDIARLIGRQGSMASSIRQMMSVCSRLDNRRITIKFESY
ncbi:MAG: KH domain-containing protein [Erysipelotrichaceae bacterium]|jgi:predicted RNA-binding protein YlqC (UPF0109 family)|nr:KH domain-containing protein [Erysipelotrichaceae bacterium]MBQ7223659.1 KH domain-containing protein [Erysipelotrichaceae bacterium]